MMWRLLHSRLIVTVAAGVVVVLNVAHPFLHAFEGGMLDSSLIWMNAWVGFTLNESSS